MTKAIRVPRSLDFFTRRTRNRQLLETAERIVDIELRLLLIARHCVQNFGGDGLQISRHANGYDITAELVGPERNVDLCALDPERWNACVSLARFGVAPGQTRLVAP
ncbi:hypothetical protein SAMN05444157_0811 [Frankineae bacterium MT45]|nr:hypothetical protein SAMN05444157_0811 [Frankineae bacterium MT45]